MKIIQIGAIMFSIETLLI